MCMVQSYTHIRSCIHTAAISWGCLCTHQRFHTQCTVHVLCMLVNMYVVMHAHYMCGHVCMNDQWTISPRKKVDLHVTVIHCTGCISVNGYQASRAAQGRWRRLYLMRADLGQEGAIPCIAYVQLLVFFPQVLSVQPVSGYIQPQQSTACRFTFCSYSSPSFYNMDILCKVSTGISLPGH